MSWGFCVYKDTPTSQRGVLEIGEHFIHRIEYTVVYIRGSEVMTLISYLEGLL